MRWPPVSVTFQIKNQRGRKAQKEKHFQDTCLRCVVFCLPMQFQGGAGLNC